MKARFLSVFLLSSIILTSLIFSTSGLHAQEKEWSLQDCIMHALENNIRLKQQRLAVSLSQEQLDQSVAQFFPDLNLNASHAYNYGRTIDPFTNDFATKRVRSDNYSASSTLVIFNGFQVLNSHRQSKLEFQASQYDLQALENDISLAIASAYLQVLFAMELADNAQRQLDISRLQVERTEKLVNAGTLARGNLYSIEALAATEELQLVNAQNQLELATLSLTQLLDLKFVQNFRIQKPAIEIPLETGLQTDPVEIYNIAFSAQPVVKASQTRVLSAEKGLQIAKGTRSPTLAMRGAIGTGYSGASIEEVERFPGSPVSIGFTETGEMVYMPSFDVVTRTTPFGTQLENNMNRSLGFYLSIPVFNRFQSRSTINRSRINLENARLQQQLVQDELFKTIQQANADARAALKRYMASQKNVDALTEAFRYMEQRFTVGMANSLDYNDAKNKLSVAQSEMVQSKYDFIFRLKVLDFYMGKPISL